MACGWQQCLSGFYDFIAACISIADVGTDIWVAYNWYNQERYEFFWVSAVVMVLAQFAYVSAFLIRFTDSSSVSCGKRVLVFFCLLPIAPVMSFIFYWASREDNCISSILTKCGLETDENSASTAEEPAITKWIKEKFSKHMGFILEAVVEAFPQSVLQMIAIVYFNETELINAVSILLSLISVSSKSLVFSYAIDVKVFLFNWISIVTDFIGIFMLIGWVFYNPSNPGEFTILGRIWLYKAIIVNVPLIIIVGGLLAILFVGGMYKNEIATATRNGWNGCQKFCVISLLSIAAIVLWICGGALALLLLEVATLAPIAFFAFIFNHDRFTGSAKRGSFFVKMFDWIFAAKSKSDEIVRICCVNRQMFNEGLHNNRLFHSYIVRNEKDAFKSITLSELRFRVSPLNPEYGQIVPFLISKYFQIPIECMDTYRKEKKKKLEGSADFKEPEYIQSHFLIVWSFVVFYVLVPMHFASRCINLFYPLLAIILIDFADIQLLQGVMTLVWLTLFSAWVVLLVYNIRIQYITWHIAPSVTYFSNLYNMNILKFYEKLQNYYERIYIGPERKVIVDDIFGKHISYIILSFIPLLDDEDE